MVDIKIGKEKYECPDRWSEVSIKKYNGILEILKLKEGDLRKNIKIISLLSGIDIEILYNLPVNELNKLPLDFLNKLPDKKELSLVNICGEEYGIIPNLKFMSLGEYIDLDELCKDAEKNFIDILSILLRKVKEKEEKDGELISYEIEEYDIKTIPKRKKIFEDELDIETAFSITNFFLYSEDGYLRNMTKYLLYQIKKIKRKKKIRQILMKDGDGQE